MDSTHDTLWPQITETVAALKPRVDAANAAWESGIALAGAGFHGIGAAHYLKAHGARLTGFFDNSPAKQGTSCEGLPIEALSSYDRTTKPFVLVTARHAVRTVEQQLAAAGIAHLSYDALFVCRNLDRLQAARARLGDVRSHHVFDQLLLARLTGHTGYCRAVYEANAYFALPEFIPAAHDHFVDAGAFVGDTIERFLWAGNGVFSTIRAFEPGAAQYAAMQARVKRLNAEWAIPEHTIILEQAALGDRNGTAHLQGTGQLQSSAITDKAEGTAVAIRTLDTVLADDKPATFIKADIEGMELGLLKGAAATIETYRPKLALSLYHHDEDFYTLIEHLTSIHPGYRFALRHHSPSLMETVLYAWMED